MRHCPICQASYEDDARFCPDDGTPLRDSPDPYIGKVFLDQFEIREICGRGSMGTVYRAWQRTMDREVAVKVLRRDLMRDPRIVKRFRREAKASARLSHPSIITVYVVGDTTDGVPFIAMEYVKGRSLDEVLAHEGRLTPLRAIHITRQICSALGEAHDQSIVHRDLKPENIFLSATSHTPDFVKILDFGIAKILYANEESLVTQNGAIFGTPYYLSPEQASGADVDHRCDLYALGVILFRMLTGRLPFDKDSGVAVLIQHLREAPPRPRDLVPDLPAPLELVVMKALEKTPASRWQSAAEMATALEAVRTYLAPGGRAAGPAEGLSHTVSDDAEAALQVQAALPEARARPQPPLPATLVGAEPAKPAAVPAAIEPAVPSSSRADSSFSLERTTSRRRLLLHLLVGLGSVASGSALGAVLYWGRGRRAVAQPAELALPGDPDAGAPDASVSRPAPDARAAAEAQAPVRTSRPRKRARRKPPPPARQPPASQPAASRPAVSRPPVSSPPASRPAPPPAKPARRRRATGDHTPVGPDPAIEGTDHAGSRTAPVEKKDEPYDMVE